jgi:glycosyltransferase involved in cell wall biosynthesis
MPFLFRISKGFISPQSLFTFWTEVKKHDVVLLNVPNFEGVFLALFAILRRKPVISLLHCEVVLPPGIINRVINFVLTIGIYIQLILSKKIIIYDMNYYEGKPFYSQFKNKMQAILPPIHSEEPDIKYIDYLKKINKQKICVGFCGRIAYEKGIEILIEAAKKIKDIHIFFAGPFGKDVVGEDTYFAQIKDRLASSHISYTLLGILSESQLSAFYKSIDMLVLPSINRTEAFGLVQVEAMFQGTPVIASNLPGVCVPICLSHMGKTISVGDSDQLANAIIEMHSHKSNYTNKDRIEKIKSIFDSQKTYKAIYNLLSSYVKKNS